MKPSARPHFASGANYAQPGSERRHQRGGQHHLHRLDEEQLRHGQHVRGRNLGGTSAERAQFKVADANDAAMVAANVGGGGTIGGTAKNVSIIPWAIGESLTTALADGNMGNTFLSYVDNRGFVPLSLTNEFSTFGAAAVRRQRPRIPRCRSHRHRRCHRSTPWSSTTPPSPGSMSPAAGAAQTLAITSGAMLFTVTGGAASTAYDTRWVASTAASRWAAPMNMSSSVVNPSSAATTSTLTATISSPLTSSR
jgi:fibronectin-binding autotransporter adhesin